MKKKEVETNLLNNFSPKKENEIKLIKKESKERKNFDVQNNNNNEKNKQNNIIKSREKKESVEKKDKYAIPSNNNNNNANNNYNYNNIDRKVKNSIEVVESNRTPKVIEKKFERKNSDKKEKINEKDDNFRKYDNKIKKLKEKEKNYDSDKNKKEKSKDKPMIVKDLDVDFDLDDKPTKEPKVLKKKASGSKEENNERNERKRSESKSSQDDKKDKDPLKVFIKNMREKVKIPLKKLKHNQKQNDDILVMKDILDIPVLQSPISEFKEEVVKENLEIHKMLLELENIQNEDIIEENYITNNYNINPNNYDLIDEFRVKTEEIEEKFKTGLNFHFEDNLVEIEDNSEKSMNDVICSLKVDFEERYN